MWNYCFGGAITHKIHILYWQRGMIRGGGNAAWHKHELARGIIVLVGQKLTKFIFCIGRGACLLNMPSPSNV
jgi:hypothetical protein